MKMTSDNSRTLPTWDETLSVGVDIIDEDHQAFFRLPTLMQDIQESEDEQKNLLIDTYINILQEYIEGHFLREQRALMAIHYEDLAEHIAAHDQFSQQVRKLIDEYKGENKESLNDIGRLVTHWMTSHIKTADQKYRGLLNNDNVDSRPLAYFLEEDPGSTA